MLPTSASLLHTHFDTHAGVASDDLIRRGIPTIITSGYDTATLPSRLRRLSCLLKPVQFQGLVQTIRKLGKSMAD